MNSWNAMTYEGRDNVLRVVRQEAKPAYGLPGMAARADEHAEAFRSVPQAELPDRAQTDYAKMTDIREGAGRTHVLTAFGRYNAGTVRGDPAAAERYLNLFFRI